MYLSIYLSIYLSVVREVSSFFLFLVSAGDGLGGLAGLLGSFSGGLGWHVVGDELWLRRICRSYLYAARGSGLFSFAFLAP